MIVTYLACNSQQIGGQRLGMSGRIRTTDSIVRDTLREAIRTSWRLPSRARKVQVGGADLVPSDHLPPEFQPGVSFVPLVHDRRG